MFVYDLRPAQQRFNAQNHFLLVHRLDHVVVGAHDEALFLVLGQLFGGDHENGKAEMRLPQLSGQLVAVQAGQHDIHDHQVYVAGVQQPQRFHAVLSRNRIISVFLQHRFHQFSCILIVFHN